MNVESIPHIALYSVVFLLVKYFALLLDFLPASFALGIQLYSWLGALVLSVLEGVIGYYIAKKVAVFS